MEFRLEKTFRVGTRESKGKFVYLIYDYLVFEGHFMVTTFGFLWILFWNSSYCEIALKFTHEVALDLPVFFGSFGGLIGNKKITKCL
ncbi:transmembrane protein, putative [Medicago truncatula]|uniref:Transmembrane protein, putative n=1 Tax=Medicago truncatula TaxID=3880 RepID=G7IC42_MEDTR|nr:transmembrane protein, putative [Medicago truncatula]